MEDCSCGEPIKVEVVNFDSITSNAVKMVVAAVAVTVVTKIVEKQMETMITKWQAKKAMEIRDRTN